MMVGTEASAMVRICVSVILLHKYSPQSRISSDLLHDRIPPRRGLRFHLIDVLVVAEPAHLRQRQVRVRPQIEARKLVPL